MEWSRSLHVTSIWSFHQGIKKVHGIWLLNLESTAYKVSKMDKIKIFERGPWEKYHSLGNSYYIKSIFY